MKLRDIRQMLEAEIISGEELLDVEIERAGASDLMSDVLAFGKPGLLLITGLSNAQSVRTASIIGAKAIVYVRGKKPDKEGAELAVQKKIPILSTKFLMYRTCGLLFSSGLHGITDLPGSERAIGRSEESAFVQEFGIVGGDFSRAGTVSLKIMEMLKVMYARKGTFTLSLTPAAIQMIVADEGAGIPDVELAMQEGYSTATEEMREMGFGAGMGLPNIKRNSDRLEIHSEVGKGTRLAISIDLKQSKSV
jgi:hypothetical protein